MVTGHSRVVPREICRRRSNCQGLMLLAAFTIALGAIVFIQTGAQAGMDRATTLILARSGPVNTLDPLRADYAESNYIISALYDTLITYDHDGNLVPNLATEYTIANDARSIAITLRPDVSFHDGTKLTAKDVAYTLDRLKRLGSGIAAQIEGYAGTDIQDDTHLTIRLATPNALFIGGLSKVYILNSTIVAANAGSDDAQSWLQAHDAGSGAYTLEGFQNNAFVLDRYDDYWAKVDGRPKNLVFRRIDESATAQAELRAGNVDLVWGLGEPDVAAVSAADPSVKVQRIKTPIQADVVFNTRKGATTDPRIRKAVALSYDYEGALKGIYNGNGILANGPLPTTLACRPDLPAAKHDPEAAKKLLAEANASNVSLSMDFQPVFETQKREATLLQSNLRKVGVTLNLVPISFPDYLASLKNPETIPQMMLFLDFAQFPDTGVVLIKSFHSKSIGSTNKAGYSNPKVDKLLDEAVVTADAAKRCDIYKQVQTIVQNDGVYMDMYTLNRPIVYRPDHVTNIVGSPVVYPIAPADLRLAGK